MKASITLESAFIYPLTIAITFTLIIYSFAMHDRLSSKATAYTHLIKQYQSDSVDTDATSLSKELSKVCLLSNSTSVYSYNLGEVHLKDRHGITSLSFSHYERCTFIRNSRAILQIIN